MRQAIDKVGTALKRLRGDGGLLGGLALSPAHVRWRFFLLCGAVVLALAWPASKAAADEVAEANARFDRQQNAPVIYILLASSSRRPFAELTTGQLRKFVEFRVDGLVMMRPRILDPIYGGGIMLLGSFNIEEAKDMASRLSSGAARLEVEAVSE